MGVEKIVCFSKLRVYFEGEISWYHLWKQTGLEEEQIWVGERYGMVHKWCLICMLGTAVVKVERGLGNVRLNSEDRSGLRDRSSTHRESLEREKRRGRDCKCHLIQEWVGQKELEKDKDVGRGGRRKLQIERGHVCHQSHGFLKESLISSGKCCPVGRGAKEWQEALGVGSQKW